MTDRRRFLAALAGLALFSLATPPAAAGPADEARLFIETLAERAIAALVDASVPRAERIRRFRALFNETFAVKSIGKWVLGRHWNQAGEVEREEYFRLFEDLMVVSYVDRFTEYAGETLRVSDAIPEDDASVTVTSAFSRPGRDKLFDVRWRVGRVGDGFKIVDVVIEGTSMSATLRSEFASAISRRGGSVRGLLDELREKTTALSTDR